MVSQAGGMALQGLLPIVHSFACFLSARPNEQIYNNATEHKKIIYVGSLAGVVPGGPGHSHQAVRDISALAAIPGLTLMEPSCETEVAMLLDWAVNTNQASSYLRLMSLPWVLPYTLPMGYTPELGKGVALTDGQDAVVIAYGPVMLSAAVQAAQALKAEHGIAVKVINLPWLNAIDANWFAEILNGCKAVFSIDNHYLIGGQGDRIANAMLIQGLLSSKLQRIALNEIPVCGTNLEILCHHALDQTSIVNEIIKALKS
jgi:transketolase